MKKPKTKATGILGFRSEYDGREMPFDEYIESVRKGEEPGALPVPVLEGIKAMAMNREDVGKALRVTSMLGCIRNLYFDQKIGELYIAPSSWYPMFRGVMAHKAMEGFVVPGAVDEKRYEREWKGVMITGKPDRIIPAERRIQDYKSTQEVPEFGKPYKSHEEQLNLYRWLVGIEYEIDELEVIYMSMKGAKAIKVRVWTDRELEAFLDEKVEKIQEALTKDILPEYEKIPLCAYCPFTTECKENALDTLLQNVAERVKNGEPMQRGVIARGLKKIRG